MKIVSEKKVVEKLKTYILRSIPLFENRAVCEIMWKNMAEPDRTQITTWRTRFACWMAKAYYFPTATMLAGTRLSVTLYVYCLSYLVCWSCRQLHTP